MNWDKSIGPERLRERYYEAIKSTWLFFNKGTREWYTPEQYRDKYAGKDLRYIEVTGILENVVIRNPMAGVSASQKNIVDKIERFTAEIERDIQKQTDFVRMAMQYYQDNFKPNR